jgi:hypothetical protein
LFIVSFNPTYMFRQAPAIFRVVVIKYQVTLFKNSVIKVKKEGQVFSKKSRCKIDVKKGPVGSCVVCAGVRFRTGTLRMAGAGRNM